jgi:hypothetical protein
MVMSTTDGPPVSTTAGPPMTFLFAGAYDTWVKDRSGPWQQTAPLYVTGNGSLVQGDRVIAGAAFKGTAVTWPAESNKSAGGINFVLSGKDTNFWPDSQQDHHAFQGTTEYPTHPTSCSEASCGQSAQAARSFSASAPAKC